MKKNQSTKVISIVFSILSVTALIVMIYLFIYMQWIKSHMVAIESTVVNVDSNDNIVIRYEYDGTTYIDNADIYKSWIEVGDTIIIYIDPSRPNINYQPDFFFYIIFPGIFVVVFGAIGFSGLILNIRYNNKKKNYMMQGKKLIAAITDLHMNHLITMRVNRNISYRSHIICEHTDEFTDAKQVFKSAKFWLPADHEIKLGTTLVHVYVDRSDAGKYFVDVQSINTHI